MGRLFLLMVSIGILGCKTEQIESRWTGEPVVIDGQDSEWGSSLVDIKKVGLVGFQNDADYLYLCFVPGDRELGRQIIAGGLNIWFDTTADHKRTVGIRYPVGMHRRGLREVVDPDTVKLNREIAMSLNEIDLIGDEDLTSRRFQLVEMTGIVVRTAIHDDKLVCEMRIPRRPNDYLTLGRAGTVDVMLETPELKRPEGVGGPGGGFRPGGMSGTRRGDGPGMARMPERKEIKVWLRVKLAGGS